MKLILPSFNQPKIFICAFLVFQFICSNNSIYGQAEIESNNSALDVNVQTISAATTITGNVCLGGACTPNDPSDFWHIKDGYSGTFTATWSDNVKVTLFTYASSARNTAPTSQTLSSGVSQTLSDGSFYTFSIQFVSLGVLTSYSVILTGTALPASVTWNGSIDNDWNNTSNWTPAVVPQSGTDVLIPSGLTNYPTASSAVTVNSVTIDSGATLIAQNTFTGNISYSRALLTNNWYLVSFPFSDEDLQDVRTNHSFDTGQGNNLGFAKYNTTNDSWIYYQTSGGNETLVPGWGYSVKLTSAGNISSSGTMLTNTVNVTKQLGGNNFNLLGNPFLSFINGGTFLTSETGDLTTETAWLWNQSLGSYDTYTPGANPNFKIAPGQGFFVEASTTGGDNTYRFTEDLQSHEITDSFQKSEERPEIILIASDANTIKKTRIIYDSNATTSFDNGYDGKMFGGYSQSFSLFTQLVKNNDGNNYAVQILPNSDYENMAIPIGLKAENGKTITFTSETLNIPNGLNVYLEDRQTSNVTKLNDANAEYKVTLSEDLDGIGRFYLYMRTNSVLDTDITALNSISIFTLASNKLRITGLQQGNISVRIFNMLGKKLINTTFTTSGVSDLDLPNLSKGVYIIQLETAIGSINKKIILE